MEGFQGILSEWLDILSARLPWSALAPSVSLCVLSGPQLEVLEMEGFQGILSEWLDIVSARLPWSALAPSVSLWVPSLKLLRRIEKMTPGTLPTGWKLRDSKWGSSWNVRALEAWSFESVYVNLSSFQSSGCVLANVNFSGSFGFTLNAGIRISAPGSSPLHGQTLGGCSANSRGGGGWWRGCCC